MKKAVFLRIVLTAAVLALLLSGCRFVRVEEEERKPVDYTIVERRDIPEELSRLMEEKKEKETRELNLILFMGQQKSLLIFHKINIFM